MDFQKIRHILIFCLVLMFATAVGKGQEPQDEASAKPCADQRKRIAAELAMPHKVTWMGTYNAFSSTFSLAPSAGFYYFRGSDYVYWSCAWGQVEIVDGKIKLIPDSCVPAEGTQGLELEWTPVVWGERNYIIPTDKLLDFVNSVNNGYEPDSFPGPIATFHKKAGDGERAVSGFPSVPESYRQYLLAKPIRGRITTVGDFEIEKMGQGKTEIRTTKVTMDVGRKDGVLAGMRFITYEPSRVHEDIIVTNVYETTSEGILKQEGKISAEVSTKWKISTSIHDIK